MSEVLYYPDFEPSVKWLRSFLLFFDKINTIVPKDANFKPSFGLDVILDKIPDSFGMISPKKRDIKLDDINKTILEKAFKIIKKQKRKLGKKETIKIHVVNGGIEIMGNVLLHQSKLSNAIRNMLTENKLLSPKLDELAKNLSGNNFHVVDKQASNLIVSCVADKIGSRLGLNTITDSQLDFNVNALNSLNIKSVKDPESLLISSIISASIPGNIESIDLKKYKQIRDNYSDIRESFHLVMIDIGKLNNIGKFENEEDLREKISKITKDFSSEIIKLKKSTFGKNIKDWSPIAIGGLLSLAGEVFSEPSITISSASLGIVVEVIQKIYERNSESEKVKIQRLMGNMKKKILKASQIKELI